MRGAAGAAVALPFLESLPERSAWAVDEQPVFSLYICAVLGVVPAQFFPAATGPLASAGLSAAGKATSHLSGHAENLLFLSGINWPFTIRADAHAEGFCQALTATEPVGSGPNALAGGPSADVVIASRVHPDLEPLTLYAGAKSGYIDERLSFAGPGEVRAAERNPYALYFELMGLATPGGGMTPDGEQAARLLAQSRNSIHDLVRDDLTALMQHSRLSSADRQRLQQHFDSIRDIEIGMGGMGNDPVERCSLQGLDVPRLEAYRQYTYDRATTTEETLRLHMSLVALAFACNYRRTATIQWGDGYDATVYDVPSNPDRNRFNWICHRNQSDGGARSRDSERRAGPCRDRRGAHAILRRGARPLQGSRSRRSVLRDVDEPLSRRPGAQLPRHPSHHLGQRGRLPEAGRVHRSRRRHEQSPPQHADQRRHSGHGDTVEDFGDVATGGMLDEILA